MRYTVQIPTGISNPIVWVNQFLTTDGYVTIQDKQLFVETEGSFTAPNAVEIPSEFIVENEDGTTTNV